MTNPCPCGKKYCNHLPKEKKQPKPIARNKTPIKPVADKLASNRRKYSVLAKQFKIDNPYCQAHLPGCTHYTQEVHHMAGRLGDDLLDVGNFLPVCHRCHTWINEHSKEAIARGLSLRRNT